MSRGAFRKITLCEVGGGSTKQVAVCESVMRAPRSCSVEKRETSHVVLDEAEKKSAN